MWGTAQYSLHLNSYWTKWYYIYTHTWHTLPGTDSDSSSAESNCEESNDDDNDTTDDSDK